MVDFLLVLLVLILSACLALAAFTQVAKRRLERRFPPRGVFVPVRGGRLHGRALEPPGGGGPTVLLVHGASGSHADLLEAIAPRLQARGFRVLAFDRPGHCWSDRIVGDQAAHPRRQAEILREAAERLGASDVILVGHSLAGALCCDLALSAPGFVRGLVLIAPVTHPWMGGVAWYYGAAAATFGPLFTRTLVMPVGLASMARVVASVFRPHPTPPDYVERTGAALVLTPARFRANAQDVLALESFVHELAPRLGGVRQPTAILAGDCDGVVSSTLHSIASARAIPHADLTILPGVGHSPHWTRPDAVVEAIARVAKHAGMGPDAERAQVSESAK